MKRELQCPKCAEHLKLNVFNKPSAPGEHVKYVKGKLMHDGLICDFCGIQLECGQDVYCMSIWADYGGIPYYKWEHEYVLLEDEDVSKENVQSS